MTHCVKGSAYVPNHGMWTNLVSWKKMADNKCSGIITILDYVRRGGLGRGSLKARWRQAGAPPGIHCLFAWGCTSVLLVFPSLLTTSDTITQLSHDGTTQMMCSLAELISVHAKLFFAYTGHNCSLPSCHLRFLLFSSWVISSTMCKLGLFETCEAPSI